MVNQTNDLTNKTTPIERCTRVPVTRITTTTGGTFHVVKDAWWVVVDDCVLMYLGRTPQYNHDRHLAERIQQRLYPGATVQQIPLAFLEVDRRNDP